VPRIIILATNDLSASGAHVTLDEAISVGLLSDEHVAHHLVERLRWGAKDAELIEDHAPPLLSPSALGAVGVYEDA
jgi:hypothetical protein